MDKDVKFHTYSHLNGQHLNFLFYPYHKLIYNNNSAQSQIVIKQTEACYATAEFSYNSGYLHLANEIMSR